MAKLRPIPHYSVPFVKPNGQMNEDWYLYFVSREKIGLSNLADVSVTAPTDGQTLTYNATTGGWEPA